MIRIAIIELTKYIRAYVIIIICFLLLEVILLSRIQAKDLFQYGTFDLDTFRVVNSIFISVIASAMPMTILLNVCNEFRNGYALKLISNGLSRTSYCKSKFILAGALAAIALVLYLLIISYLLLTQATTYFDKSIFISSSIETFLFTMFLSSIAVSLSLLFRSWQFALLAYYGYSMIEAFVVIRFEETLPSVKYLPFYLLSSIFELRAVPEKLADYLLPAGILIPFCFAIVWICTHFFKKADL
jgi:putative exporter of polyketide antibiotics